MKFLLDTNIIIYYLQDLLSPEAGKYMDDLLVNHPTAISFISEIELLCWKTEKVEDIEVIKQFIDHVHVVEMNPDIKQMTIEIRRSNNVKLPDAIIAATAKTSGYTLVTRNKKDFKDIELLNLINPFEL